MKIELWGYAVYPSIQSNTPLVRLPTIIVISAKPKLLKL